MPWALMSQADVPRGGTVRADVSIMHPQLTEQALPSLPTSGGFEAALGQSRDSGWTGVRANILSPLLKTQLRAGSLGLGLQEGQVMCPRRCGWGMWGGVHSVRVYEGTACLRMSE